MYDLVNLFKDIKPHKAIILCFAALSILFPGVLFIYEFMPNVFTGDGLKIQLLAAAISFGLLLGTFFCFCLYFFEPEGKQLVVTEKTIWVALLFASIFCSTELLIMSFIKMWIGSAFKASLAITICASLNFILLLDSIRDYKGRKKVL